MIPLYFVSSISTKTKEIREISQYIFLPEKIQHAAEVCMLFTGSTLQNYADIFLFEVFQRRENLAVVSILYEAGMLTMR